MATRILVIDDSSTVRQQVTQTLLAAGFEVSEARNGQEGLEALRKHEDLALVLCDVNMPHMDGIEMLALAKQDPAHADLPVVMLTTEGQPELIRRAKQAGAAGWIVKPFNPEQLIAAVRKLTGSRAERADPRG
jgi:two-component system, chemotaxis family, chemotaxis protein CheY